MAQGKIYFLYDDPNGEEDDLGKGQVTNFEKTDNKIEFRFSSEGVDHQVDLKKDPESVCGYDGYWTCEDDQDRFYGRCYKEPCGYTFIGEHLEDGYKYKVLMEIIN